MQPVIEKKAEPVAAAPKPAVAAPAAAPVQQVQPAALPAMVNAASDALARLQTQQSEATHIHEKYLENEAEYGRIFVQTTQLGMSLVTNAAATPQQIDQALNVLQSVERSMMRFHDHQSETLRVHEQYLKNQEEFARNYVQLASQQLAALQGSPAATMPSTPPVTPVAAPAPAVHRPVENVRKAEPVVTVALNRPQLPLLRMEMAMGPAMPLLQRLSCPGKTGCDLQLPSAGARSPGEQGCLCKSTAGCGQ